MLKNLLSSLRIPEKFTGPVVNRKEPCCICRYRQAMKLGEVDFWDLQHCDIVKCESCNHMQLDPKLTTQSTDTGCFAYHVDEMLRIPEKEQFRNLVRNFRRGVLFGSSLKNRGFTPKDVLEFGPGSGYFAAGIQFIFPDAKVTVVDIVDDVLKRNKEVHGFVGVRGTPEDVAIPGRKFDLIIAKDIMEHVNDISLMIKNVSALLNEQGLFHFTTPNGHEDVWGHYLRWKKSNRPSELLINHVNYFDGKCLKELLVSNNLHPLEYYTYEMKWAMRGRGWSMKEKRVQKESVRTSASKLINEKRQQLSDITFDKNQVLDQWYVNSKNKWITTLFSWYQHHHTIKLDPEMNVGHEIYGLFQLKIDN